MKCRTTARSSHREATHASALPKSVVRMPSFKSRRRLFVLRHSRKKAFSSRKTCSAGSRAARKTEDHQPPAWLVARFDIKTRTVAGCPGLRDRAAATRQDDSGFSTCTAAPMSLKSRHYHWSLIAEMAERLGLWHDRADLSRSRPSTISTPCSAWSATSIARCSTRRTREDIIFMGDSAGGNMAVVLTMMAADEGLPAAVAPRADLARPRHVAVQSEAVRGRAQRPLARHSRRPGGDPPLQRRHRPQRLAHQPALWRPVGAAQNAAADRLARPAHAPTI